MCPFVNFNQHKILDRMVYNMTVFEELDFSPYGVIPHYGKSAIMGQHEIFLGGPSLKMFKTVFE